jgi:hypothetical protein
MKQGNITSYDWRYRRNIDRSMSIYEVAFGWKGSWLLYCGIYIYTHIHIKIHIHIHIHMYIYIHVYLRTVHIYIINIPNFDVIEIQTTNHYFHWQ